MYSTETELVIYFKDKLHKTLSGYSSGGAVFPDEVVLDFDEDKNSLRVVAPATIKKERGLIQLEYKNGIIIFMIENKVLRIEEVQG